MDPYTKQLLLWLAICLCSGLSYEQFLQPIILPGNGMVFDDGQQSYVQNYGQQDYQQQSIAVPDYSSGYSQDSVGYSQGSVGYAQGGVGYSQGSVGYSQGYSTDYVDDPIDTYIQPQQQYSQPRYSNARRTSYRRTSRPRHRAPARQSRRYSYGAGPTSYQPRRSRASYYAREGRSYEPDPYDYAPSYHKPKPKTRPIYIPVPVTKKKKKKDKTITMMQGMFIPGGLQLFGKFKSVKECKDHCDKIPNCFAGDFNKWLYKCYIHTNVTACSSMQSHSQMMHFKKIPCSTLELPTPNSLIVLGAQLFRGFEQKGIEDLKTCIKKCTSSGAGIARTLTDAEDTQVCFAINFNFAQHKCYVFPLTVNNVDLCTNTTVPVPRDLVANPAVVHITLCPLSLA